MWDWSIKSSGRKIPEKKEQVNSYDSGVNVNLYENASEQNLSSTQMKLDVEQLLHTYKLSKMQLRIVHYAPKTWEEMRHIFNEYQRKRSAFLKMVGYGDKDELEAIGLSPSDIELLKKGIAPENYNTHLKIPFDFGGDTDFENFSLLRTHHIHSNIHRVIDYQIANGFLLKEKFIYLPYFDGRFYYD